MNVLFVTAFPLEMNSSATIQNKIIIKGLKDLGHHIDVLTTGISPDYVAYDPSMVSNDVDVTYRASLAPIYTTMQIKKQQSIGVTWLKMKLRDVYNYFKIYDGYKTCIPTIGKINFESKTYDFVISASDPKSSHLMAKTYMNLFAGIQTKWIQYWGDPMYTDITRRKRMLDFQIKAEEGRLLESADGIVYASPFTAEDQKKIFPKLRDKISYATQGYYELTSVQSEKNEHYTIGYFGTYNSKIRNLEPLYGAAIDNPSFQLILCGSSDLVYESHHNIKVMPAQRYEKVQASEMASDLLVCVCNNRGTQIPGKIYYYANHQKPILVIIDGQYGPEIKSFLSQFNRYYFCENNKDAINKAIREIRKRSHHHYSDLNELSPAYMAQRMIQEV